MWYFLSRGLFAYTETTISMLMMRFLTRKFNEDATESGTARFEPLSFHRNEDKYLYSILLLIKSLTRARGVRSLTVYI